MYTFKDNVLKISVRSLVEFICRSGDIDTRRGQGGDKAARLTAEYKSRWVHSMRRRFR